MFCKKAILRNFANSQKNTCARDETIFNKVAGLRSSLFPSFQKSFSKEHLLFEHKIKIPRIMSEKKTSSENSALYLNHAFHQQIVYFT